MISRVGWLPRCAMTLLLITVAAARAADEPAYTPKGADTCLKCHDEDKQHPVVPIFRTPHAQRADSRTPFAGLQCEACHGPGGDHAKAKDDDNRPHIRDFGAHAKTSVAEQNGVCLGCHQGGERTLWHDSAHERNDVSCTSCHTVHAEHDPVLARASQPEICFTCHQRERAQSMLPSAHPIRFGEMACSDCHAPHGSQQEALLKRPTLNETCFTCHADKRGPFLWEHAPVAEDCSLCHQPHGSTQQAMLTRPAPLMCQQCHSQDGHPSVPYTATGLAPGTPSGFLLAGGCTNCHSQVHGSNHPSGAHLLR